MTVVLLVRLVLGVVLFSCSTCWEVVILRRQLYAMLFMLCLTRVSAVCFTPHRIVHCSIGVRRCSIPGLHWVSNTHRLNRSLLLHTALLKLNISTVLCLSLFLCCLWFARIVYSLYFHAFLL